MNPYQYKTIPLSTTVADVKETAEQAAANRLQKLINDHAQQGWEYYRVDTLDTAQKLGCFGIWLGSLSPKFHSQVVTFRKPLAPKKPTA
jgi:hypothetical protein